MPTDFHQAFCPFQSQFCRAHVRGDRFVECGSDDFGIHSQGNFAIPIDRYVDDCVDFEPDGFDNGFNDTQGPGRSRSLRPFSSCDDFESDDHSFWTSHPP